MKTKRTPGPKRAGNAKLIDTAVRMLLELAELSPKEYRAAIADLKARAARHAKEAARLRVL